MFGLHWQDKEDRVTKLTKIYMIVMAILIALTLVTAVWHSQVVSNAQVAVTQAGHATKNNGGVAANYANATATEANNLRFFLVLSGSLLAAAGIWGLVEYVFLPFINLSRIGAITQVTYHEALYQPFTLIVFVTCIAAIVITAFVPFNTFGEDTKMYRDVAMSFILMFILVIMVFATAKVIDEEIENRTMLTLMSKPVARWQVIIGKYLGIACLIFVTMAICTIVAAACAWLRYFSDQRIDLSVASYAGQQALFWANDMAIIALIPAFVLQFTELATLAAISTAIATRYSLALNMTVIVVLYIGANLTRFVPLLHLGAPWQTMVDGGSYFLPYLTNFDINQALIYRSISMPGHYQGPDAPTLSEIVSYVSLATVYGLMYIGAALSVAVALFRNRELT